MGEVIKGSNQEQVVSKRVAVFGLGYVGLPLIRACINAGHTVVGFDID